LIKVEKVKKKKNPAKEETVCLANGLEVSKLISEQLEIYQQICLVNFIQIIWWRNTKNIDLVKKLENLKFYLRTNIQPRLAWEITFLKISMEDI